MNTIIAVLSMLALRGPGLPAGRALPFFWGAYGHTLAARAAVQNLPADMPPFFRQAADQLVYLDPEPDRWRDRVETRLDPALNGESAPEHWIDLELVPDGAFEAKTRFAFIVALVHAGQDPAVVGMLPYRILELAQRLRSDFRRWRQETDPTTRGWIEQRILNDAGILGHYVTDGGNPHHTTLNHDHWTGDNPDGYTTQPGFHARFESQFVEAKIKLEDVLPGVTADARVLTPLRAATLDYLRHSHALVERLYQLDKQQPFGRDDDVPEHKAFAAERLAASATMLRDVWWTAWVTSAGTENGGNR